MALVASLRQHINFTRFEPTFGGRFPREEYSAIVERIYSMLSYMALISYASATFTTAVAGTTDYTGAEAKQQSSSANNDQHNNDDNDDDKNNTDDPATSTFDTHPTSPSAWKRDFATLIRKTTPSNLQHTSTLTLLSACLTQSTPLPPHLSVPRPFPDPADALERLDQDVLGVRHVFEPAYAAFAVVQVASGVVGDDLRKILDRVRGLVGEVDFGFEGKNWKGDGATNGDEGKGKRD